MKLLTQGEMRVFDQFDSDVRFFSRNYNKLKKKYRDMFIAIKNKRVVASAKTEKELLKEMKEKGLDPAVTVVEFVPSKEELILF
ncbi:MAG: hypothetical protein DRP03_02045 [Candidatus Aenigmatarchaeota archaeon]|nr:MAG: hypothetical protein DRP03_02045 [Candidatus Aenigmarchaeota archaeon]